MAGFQCNRALLNISHLFFTNDNFLFSKASKNNRRATRTMLDKYVKVSDQVINFNKSSICVSKSIGRVERRFLAKIVVVRLVDCHERGWNIPLIRAYFVKEDVENYFSLPIALYRIDDLMIKHFDKGGVYYVQSGYKVGWELETRKSVSGTNAVKVTAKSENFHLENLSQLDSYDCESFYEKNVDGFSLSVLLKEARIHPP
ncbi:hypothetical protein Ddye_012025 [Dipteronia dyeriana]|uniref:Uncharacterized protein n=1 Tax=Dipteronia dyeriana TaxID=168575 RepID=A0AAD9X3N4_9ROSI|nr:hypothetical protein Ddye_012025 [Dipteronia dyeriana]